MRLRSVLALGIITALLCSSFAASALFATDSSSSVTATPNSTSIAMGSIVILPNGNVTATGTAAGAVSHTTGSDYYNLTDFLIGSLQIERSGVIFNGNGTPIENISNTFGSSVVNISNANNVSFLNTYIITGNETALSFYNTTNDKANFLSIVTNTTGVMVGDKTSYINVSNSFIADNLTSTYAPIFSGIAPGASGPLATSNISFYNLSVVENLTYAPYGYPPAFVIASPYTTLEGSSITEMGQPGIGVGDVANNTRVTNNLMLLMQNGIGIVNGMFSNTYSGPIGPVFMNNTVDGNTILLDNATTGFSMSDMGIDSNSQGTISSNTISGNYTGALVGISQYAPNSTISGNSITIGAGFGSAAVYFYNSSISILNNVGSLNSGLVAYGAFGQSNSGNPLNNILIENNTFDTNGSISGGISMIGFSSSNSTVSGNNIVSQGVQSTGAVLSGNNTDVTQNSIFVQSRAGSGAMAKGIMYGLNGPNRDVNISTNNVYVSATNTSAGLILYDTNYSAISSNHVVQNVTQTTLNSSLALMAAVNHTMISGNTFNSGENYSTFALNMSFSQNDTFANNMFSGSSGLFNFSESGNNLFYHNDFMKYANYGSSLNSSGNRFNLSYPVGGNYWGSTVTLVDNHSGPGQNLSGSDGIGDNQLTMSVGVDYYPLVYQWNDSTVTITENGLPAGQQWSFAFNGKSYTTSNTSMTFSMANGAYSFTSEGTSLYYAQHANGTVTYDGSNISINVNYVHLAYLSGSVSPSTYTLYLNGTMVIENSTSFNTTIRPGTYELEIKSPGYNTYYENFTVSANQTEHVNVNLTSNSPANSTNNTTIPRQDLYYAAGGVAAVVVVAAGAFTLRRRNTGK